MLPLQNILLIFPLGVAKVINKIKFLKPNTLKLHGREQDGNNTLFQQGLIDELVTGKGWVFIHFNISEPDMVKDW